MSRISMEKVNTIPGDCLADVTVRREKNERKLKEKGN